LDVKSTRVIGQGRATKDIAMHFLCACCGRVHEGPTQDWAFRLPDEVWSLPEAERPLRARFDTDLCRLGSRYFIRGLLAVPLNDRREQFRWGVWAEASREVFERYLHFYDKDGTGEPSHPGVLANALAPYEGSLGAPLRIQFQDAKTRPAFRVAEGEGGALGRDQRSGVDDVRYFSILHMIGAFGSEEIGSMH
jgi:hypothetical protein